MYFLWLFDLMKISMIDSDVWVFNQETTMLMHELSLRVPWAIMAMVDDT